MRTILLLIILTGIIPGIMAQDLTENKSSMNDQSVDNADSKLTQSMDAQVVVNLEMIRRFRDLKTESDIYSWSQLLLNNESSTVHELILSYRNVDMNEQSLESIKLALEEKIRNQEILPSESAEEEEYYATINRIKQEISGKLGSGSQVAMK